MSYLFVVVLFWFGLTLTSCLTNILKHRLDSAQMKGHKSKVKRPFNITQQSYHTFLVNNIFLLSEETTLSLLCHPAPHG